ncbi:MAG: hypothetical protein V3V81_07910 [Candidatus Bathyarchaeia archaeon]
MKGIIEVKPVIIRPVHSLCVRPYPNHTKGCPNYGKKKGCPPNVSMFDVFYNLSKPIYAIYNVFDFGMHVNRMEYKHPDWSKRQLECCLYWQGTARKELKERTEAFKRLADERYVVNTVPEAMGVNVTETMKRVGIELEWPPVNVTYQVAMAGIPRSAT